MEKSAGRAAQAEDARAAEEDGRRVRSAQAQLRAARTQVRAALPCKRGQATRTSRFQYENAVRRIYQCCQHCFVFASIVTVLGTVNSC